MTSSNIKVGDRIEISMKSDEAIKKKYTSIVEEVYENNQLLIYRPISYGSLVRFSLGEIYSLVVIGDKSIYRYDAKFTKYINKEDYNFMLAKLCSKGEKIQRREFFRFNCILPFRFEKIPENTINGESFRIDTHSIALKGVIKDIGGGGIRFISNEMLEENDKIKCFIVLAEDYVITFGKILERMLFNKSESEYKYQYRVEFLWIKESEKEQIIRYIFNQQRKVAQRIKEVVKN